MYYVSTRDHSLQYTPAQAIAQAGLSPSVRPEQLTLEDFYRLTQALYQPQPGLGD